MTQEEKSKAFDNAIEKAKDMLDRVSKGENILIKEELISMFPSLKESVDEKTRQEILNYIKTGVYRKSWVDWLEKQRKPTWSEVDSLMIDETLFFIKEFQMSNRCKNENDMQNSVTCEKWLIDLRDKMEK